jgi:hypothetical protein
MIRTLASLIICTALYRAAAMLVTAMEWHFND